VYRKEVNERSPMRVFEKSMHGGLGRGHVGVVLARAGVGKTSMLVQIALDDLLRDKKVLHISHDHAVDRVRAYYDEIFHDLAIAHELTQPQMVRLEMERNRLIYSHLEASKAAPPSVRGGTSSIGRIQHTLTFSTDFAHFKPDAIIIDGFDFAKAKPEAVEELNQVAKDLNVELWLSAKTEEYTETPASAPSPESTPAPLRRFFDMVDVIVLLQPERDEVRLQLIKDHDNPDVTDLHLHLDPNTMRVINDDLPPRSRPAKDPTKFRLFAGGAKGAEATFGSFAEEWGVHETHFSFEGHPFREREQGVVMLNDAELRKGDFSLVYASHRLGRPLSEIPNIKRILQTVWHQITHASEVFVIGALQENGTVRGGTGWGAELARLWSKPVCVFDQERGTWFRWDTTRWRRDDGPTIERNNFAGIGTTKLTTEGRAAVRAMFERTFGPPSP
jgi:KaiC/GvpD/RAD55 family RecA-like ATPase